MNQIPALFIEHLIKFFDDEVDELVHLSGYYSRIAQDYQEKSHFDHVGVFKGKIIESVTRDRHGNTFLSGVPLIKYQQSFFVIMYENTDEDRINKALFSKMQESSGMLAMTLNSGKLGKNWINYISSWKTLNRVSVMTEISPPIHRLLNNLVCNSRVITISFHSTVFTFLDIGIVIDFLKQPQFRTLRLYSFCPTLYDSIWSLWYMDDPGLRGKEIEFLGYFPPHDLNNFLISRKDEKTIMFTMFPLSTSAYSRFIVKKLTIHFEFHYSGANWDDDYHSIMLLYDSTTLRFS
ncbi:hypothetical protein L596_004942 [Steinernema carpocapsae]|uniref:Uncharacterized protein n=1 Tax=Steinernema carpocapsae TaxID=34508 RepID=A0A4U8V0Z5_STECR|nr:hypothetical protein L596_004942 [Steinernema carpocapsae]